ncbi:uncharacterized protein LOC133199818 [Saccostrea echinata]|uniref:uncharacterized protein LOC133199818 n=1 Tax=Saccostrea echinata TaxID=191078 RepID=UPI002A7EE0A9|nr:uncharacterized protein LOC133199818 [Saccostrea echinata]
MKEGDEGKIKENQPRRSEREKRMTEKELLESSEDKDTIKSAYSKWLDRYKEFLVSQDEVKAWLSPSEQTLDEDKFRRRDEQLMEVKDDLYNSGRAQNHNRDHEGLLIVAQELNKPKSEIQKFEGNPMDYQRFIRQFNTKVCANTSSYEERLNFLLQFTSFEANRIVTGYSHLNAEGGYKAALDEFKDRYGDPDIVAQAYVRKALNWSSIKQDNARGLDDYAIFLTECQHAVNNVTSARALEYPENMKLIIKKLPFYLQEKWRNVVYELKDRREVLKFENLVKFVRKESKKANDPIYGREVMNTSTSSAHGQNVKPATFSKQKRNFAAKAVECHLSINNYASEQPKPKSPAFVRTMYFTV